MKKKFEDLRKQAIEKINKNGFAINNIENKQEIETIIEELNILQIELELQNDELQKTHQITLKESEKFQNIFNNSPIGYLSITNEGKIIEANNTICNLLNISKTAIMQTPITKYISSGSQDNFYLYLKTIITTKKSNETTKIILKSQNKPIIARIQNIFLTDKLDNTPYILLSITDLTTIENNKKNILREVESNKLIANLSKSLLSIDFSFKDISDKILETARKLTNSPVGYVGTIEKHTEDLISHTLSEMIKGGCTVNEGVIRFPKINGIYNGLWGHCLNTKKAFFTNNPQAHKNSKGIPKGHVPVKRFLSYPIITNNKLIGQIALANAPDDYTNTDIEIIGKIADIYAIAIAKKESIDELVKAKEAAEVSDKLKTAFLSTMSHEIRTPMNSILGFTELLLDSCDEKKHPENHSYLKLVFKNANALMNLLNDIIDISKIKSDQLSVFKEYFAFNDLIKSAYQPYIDKNNKDLKFTIINELENQQVILYNDYRRLLQILNNVLSNAFKFTKQGEIKLEVKKQKAEITIKVTDTGIGISEEKQQIIFDPFRQIDDSMSRQYGGTGLGLAITKSLIDILGGKINLTSKIGIGSCFTISIPVSEKDNFPQETDIDLHYNFKNKTIVIIEDNLETTLVLTKYLELAFATVYSFDSAIGGITFCINNPIDLIFVDIHMPDMNGLDAVEKILETKPTLPIIAQSASSFTTDIDAAKQKGCIDFLSKPYNKLQVFEMLKKYL